MRQRSGQAIPKDNVLINKVNLAAVIIESTQADFTLGCIYRDVYYNTLLFSLYIWPQLQLKEIRYQGFRFSKNYSNLFLPAYYQRSLQQLPGVLRLIGKAPASKGSLEPSSCQVFSPGVYLKKRRFPQVLSPKADPIEPILRLRFKRKDLPLLTTRSSVSFVVLSSYSTRRILAKRSLAVFTRSTKFWRKSSAQRQVGRQEN